MRLSTVLLLLVLGCGDDAAAGDAGLDAGVSGDDAGHLDGGASDAGSSADARPPDDAGSSDAGSTTPDAGPALPPVTCDVVAEDESALDEALAELEAGDTVCLAAGEWEDLTLEVVAEGTEEAPVTIAAEVPGETSLTGEIAVRMAGSHVVVTGLVLRDGRASGSHLIDFRVDDEECSGCRLSDVAVLELDDEGDTKWVSLRGEDNRVDHCAFVGKENDGALLVIWRPDDGPDRHRIDHNYFGERPDLGRNGGETLRVGTSDQHDSSSFTVVEDNYFYRSDGEVEIISNKSGENVYRRNVFEECAGMLTLRHGQDALVEGNVFLVGGVAGGGIRVVDRGHRVVNNYVEGCRSTSNVRGGIVLMLSDEDPAMNGYQQVADVVVAHNTIVDCEQSLLFGGGRATEAPRDVTLTNNLLDADGFTVVREEEALLESSFEGNVYAGELGIDAEGFTEGDAELIRSGVLQRGVGIDGVSSDVAEDIDGEARSDPPDVGADEVSDSPRMPITRAEVGPSYDFEALR